MSTEHKIPLAARGLIVSVDGSVSPEQAEEMARAMSKKFGLPVFVANAPVSVHPVPDIEYGIQDYAGGWHKDTRDIVVGGTKSEMLATMRQLGLDEFGYTVQPLPTE